MEKIANWLWQDKETTESTNDDAIAFSKEVISEKFIISAKEQTKGRGRRGRSWVGLEGNLFFSQGVVFEPKHIGELIFISSLSLHQTIQKLLPDGHNAQLKWPNDILIDNRKVSGMLLERGEGDYFIIGIGVNICASPRSSEMIYPTTNLKENGINIDRLSFLRSYIENFDINMKKWKDFGFSRIKEQWISAAKGLGEEIALRTAEKETKGIFAGLGEQGELLLNQNGNILKIYAGDVFYIKKEENE